jgi:APA family basic amino acid/polyamine antiporter
MKVEQKLRRKFGLLTAVAIIIGQVIGVGIFLTPAGMAKSVGSPFWLLVIWLVMSAMALSGALCYGELAARFPQAGGSYVYLREAYGRRAAFLYGWMVMLVLDPGLTAAFAVGLTTYVGYFTPLSPVGKQILAISVVFITGTVNIFGVGIGANFLKVLTLLKIGTLLFLVCYGFFGGFGNWGNFLPFFSLGEGSDLSAGKLAGGLVGAFFAFAGWWEVRNAERNFPKALMAGVVSITVIYILTSAVFLYLVPLSQVASDETFAAQVGEVLFGRVGGAVFASIVIVSILGTLIAYLLVSPRVYYAMAQDGSFFQTFGQLHPRFKTPHRATIIQMVLAGILILSGNFNQIISYFFFIVVLFIGLTVAGLFIIRKREFTGYKTQLYPFTPIFFIILTTVILFMIFINAPLQSSLGAGVVLLGIPIYALLFSHKIEGKNDGLDKNDSI